MGGHFRENVEAVLRKIFAGSKFRAHTAELHSCTHVEKFVGFKFRDLQTNHENNENWHPTTITRYTVLVL